MPASRSRSRSVRTLLSAAALSSGIALPAAAQTQVAVDDGHLLSLTVGGQTFSAAELATARSTGAVSVVGGWGVPIAAADELDLDRYFARNGAAATWDVAFHTPWREADDAAPDFFVFEVGGNDTLVVRPRFADGTLGQPRSFDAWQATGYTSPVGPNQGQPVDVLAIDAGQLLDASGAPVGPDDLLAGLRIESAGVDGAAFCHLPAPADTPYRHRPRIAASHAAVPEGTSTMVVLSAVAPALGGPWAFEWELEGATFLAGFGPTHPTVRVEVDGTRPATAVLRAHPVGDPDAVAKAERAIPLALAGGATLRGTPTVWHPLELRFESEPYASTGVNPNPFTDRRLDVVLTTPGGETLEVPGFFDGDGEGGGLGGVWACRLAPDEPGTWSFQATLRSGAGVATLADPSGAPPVALAGASGAFQVGAADPAAPGFLAKGRVAYTGEHHLVHAGTGERFLKGGTDSPENLLGYRWFRGAADTDLGGAFLHEYAPHVGDWDADADPELPLSDDPGDRGLVGALSYLSSVGVNSIYFLPMNMGGDGRDTVPFGYSDTSYARTHYALDRLDQWEAVFRHATASGILLHFVLAETEQGNEQWFDGGGFGPERRLYYRELVARFSHHLGVKWNICEENDFPAFVLMDKADRLRALDPYDHPVAVHTKPDQFSVYSALWGDPSFDASSVQYSPNLAGQHTEFVRAQSAAAGRPWVAALDENNPADVGLTDTNAVDLRKRVLWDVYLSGGELEWYGGYHPLPLGGDLNLEDFRTREAMWLAMRDARELVASLPIWSMEPADALLAGESAAFGGGEVFADPGHVYAVYLPEATGAPTLDLTGHPGPFQLAWFDPRGGGYIGAKQLLQGGSPRALGAPPSDATEDWVAVVRRPVLWSPATTISAAAGVTTTLHLDGGIEHAGELYAVLGSLSGDAPGLPLGGGVKLPLVFDSYTALTLSNPALTALGNSIHVLDDAGRADVTFTLAPGEAASFVGLQVWHAFAAGVPVPVIASDALSWTIGP